MVAIVGWMVYASVVIPVSLVTGYLQIEGLRSPLGEVMLILINIDEVLEVPREVAQGLELEAIELSVKLAHGFA